MSGIDMSLPLLLQYPHVDDVVPLAALPHMLSEPTFFRKSTANVMGRTKDYTIRLTNLCRAQGQEDYYPRSAAKLCAFPARRTHASGGT